MSVRIKDIKNKGVSDSSNPFEEWVQEKKGAVKQNNTADTPSTTSNPFDDYFKKKSGTEDGFIGLPKDIPSNPPLPEDSNDLISRWHRRSVKDTQLEEAQKQGGLYNFRPDQEFDRKMNSGELSNGDVEALRKRSPEKYNQLATDTFGGEPGDAFLKSQSATQLLSEKLNKNAINNQMIFAKTKDAEYYKNLPVTVATSLEPVNKLLLTDFKPTTNLEESQKQLQKVAEESRKNQQQIDHDKIVNKVYTSGSAATPVYNTVTYDVTNMTDEQILSFKNTDENLYNRLTEAKQKVNTGLQQSAVLHNALMPLQTQFGNIALNKFRQDMFYDTDNRNSNDVVRKIGEEIYKQKDPETFALYQKAGGYDNSVPYSEQKFNTKLDQVNKDIMTLGYNAIRGYVASNGTQGEYENVFDNLKYLDYKFSTPLEQETKHRIAVALKQNGINPSKATQQQKDDIAKSLPEENQQVWFNKSKESGDTDLPNTGFWYSAGKGAIKTGTNILQSGSVLSPTSWATLFLGKPTDKETAQEILGEKMQSNVLGENPESRQRYDELKYKQQNGTLSDDEQKELNDLSSFTDVRTAWDKFKDGNGNMVGMIAAITADNLPTLRGGIASKALTGATGEAVESIAANKNLIQKLIPQDTEGIINLAKNKNEMFALMHHDNAKKAMELFPEDDTKKAWYTGITDVIAVALPNILPTNKLSEIFNNEAKSVVESVVSKINEKDLDKAVIDNMMRETANKIINKSGTFLVGAEKSAAEAALTMSLLNLGNNITQAILKPESISTNDVANNFKETFTSTFLDSQILGLIGGKAAVQKKYGKVGVDAIYDMTDNQNSINSVKYEINRQVSNKTLTQDEANKKISLLNRASQLRPQVDELQKEESLTPSASKRIFLNLINETILKSQIKKLKKTGASESLISPKEERISEINQINKKIIGRDIIVDDDLTLIDKKVKEEREAEGVLAQKDTEIKNTFEKIEPILSEEQIQKAQPVIDRVHGAEYINEKELNDAQDILYEALDKHPESSHLIEPLILKLQDYEFKTKTETSTVTEREPIEGTYANKSKKIIKPALEQASGSEAEITTADGGTRKGTINIKGGQYVLDIPKGEQVVIGEKAITDRDLKLPSEERMAEPIQFDEDGNVKSVTFETRKGDLVTIKNPEKALDLAIQLKAEAVGEIPDAAFEKAYKEVEKTITKEVPIEVSKPEIKKEETKTIDLSAEKEKELRDADKPEINLNFDNISLKDLVKMKNPLKGREKFMDIKKEKSLLDKIIKECL